MQRIMDGSAYIVRFLRRSCKRRTIGRAVDCVRYLVHMLRSQNSFQVTHV
jgi:hypothetical protein